MTRKLISFIPDRYACKMIAVKKYILSLRYMGLRFRCPVCHGSFRTFLSAGIVKRKNACCPRCGSLERHRFIWKYMEEKTDLFKSEYKVLHTAPEQCFENIFRSLPNLDYISIDLYSPLAMAKMDITDLKFGDNEFNCILCVHVLEHIPNDLKAMQELYRVLKPGGWAILQVPIKGEKKLV